MPLTHADLVAARDALRRNLDNLRQAYRRASLLPDIPDGELAHRHACIAELEARVGRFDELLSQAPTHLRTVVVVPE